jgi:hypothetical protein
MILGMIWFFLSALTLLVPGVGCAYDTDHALPAYDPAVLAKSLY